MKMKPHIFEAVDRAHTEHVHIRCGSDIQQSLQEAGLKGRFLEFSDPFCQGPVHDAPLVDFMAARRRFIADAYGLALADVMEKQAGQYDALENLHTSLSATLWFEHDSYDQLILAYILHRFHVQKNLPPIDIICINKFDGVDKFYGLGQLSPAQLTALWETTRLPLTPDMTAAGDLVWRALTAPDPAGLYELAKKDCPSLPYMACALKRHLAELPSVKNGLGLTQQLVLDIIASTENMTAGKAFSVLMREKEPLPFLGDTMFWHVVQMMTQGENPLLTIAEPTKHLPWPEQEPVLTKHGFDVLAGAADYMQLSPPVRHVGGVTLQDAACWRWDGETGSPVLAS